MFDEGVIVRIAGRKLDGRQQIFAPLPYPTFEEAWPAIRAIIRKRLRNGYQIVDAEVQAAKVGLRSLTPDIDCQHRESTHISPPV